MVWPQKLAKRTKVITAGADEYKLGGLRGRIKKKKDGRETHRNHILNGANLGTKEEGSKGWEGGGYTKGLVRN